MTHTDTKTAHTPWPWTVFDPPDGPMEIHSDALSVDVCTLYGGHEHRPGIAADAALISAAPDLLFAAKAALNDRMYREWPHVADLLIAAIAKAEDQ